MASNITQRVQLTCTDAAGDIVQGMVSATAAQGGTGAFSNVQSIASASSVLIDVGGLAVPVLLFFKNEDLTNTVYVDIASPATTGAPIKLLPGQCAFVSSAIYTWHAIAPGYVATPILLQVVAVAQ
jgi:hypothetical protein